MIAKQFDFEFVFVVGAGRVPSIRRLISAVVGMRLNNLKVQ